MVNFVQITCKLTHKWNNFNHNYFYLFTLRENGNFFIYENADKYDILLN